MNSIRKLVRKTRKGSENDPKRRNGSRKLAPLSCCLRLYLTSTSQKSFTSQYLHLLFFTATICEGGHPKDQLWPDYLQMCWWSMWIDILSLGQERWHPSSRLIFGMCLMFKQLCTRMCWQVFTGFRPFLLFSAWSRVFLVSHVPKTLAFAFCLRFVRKRGALKTHVLMRRAPKEVAIYSENATFASALSNPGATKLGVLGAHFLLLIFSPEPDWVVEDMSYSTARRQQASGSSFVPLATRELLGKIFCLDRGLDKEFWVKTTWVGPHCRLFQSLVRECLILLEDVSFCLLL